MAVTMPRIATMGRAVAEASKIGCARTTRYTPAVTMVAAWMRADTGVGPSMASGSHTCNGSWADFPTAPANSSKAMTVRSEEHTSELQSQSNLVCRLLLEKKKSTSACLTTLCHAPQ